MKLTRYGRKEWLGWGVVAFVLIDVIVLVAVFAKLYLLLALAAFVLLCWVALALFFRDPARRVPEGDDIFVSPADGVVRDIETLEKFDHDASFNGRPAVRIGIFLSVLNVHLNRAPAAASVLDSCYKPGCFHDARDPRASKENESNTLVCEAQLSGGRRYPMLVKQISGAIAKRIVCAAVPGEILRKGERFGMIKFGSRTELYLPLCPEIELAVKIGDRVNAGSTVVARLKLTPTTPQA